MSSSNPAKYLRFVRSLALGALVASGCGGDASAPTDSGAQADTGMDGGEPDDAEVEPPDTGFAVVDGPLHPPNLPRRTARA